MTDINENDNTIHVRIEPTVKNEYKKLCDSMGSNMSVELRKVIYEQLKENNK